MLQEVLLKVLLDMEMLMVLGMESMLIPLQDLILEQIP